MSKYVNEVDTFDVSRGDHGETSIWVRNGMDSSSME